MQKKLIYIALAVCTFVLFSCSAARDILHDGYYSAEMAEFDNYGWKEYITIRVSGGRIVFMEYDAFNLSGFLKSWDINYMRVMNATDGIYPNAYTRQYARMFLDSQGTEGVDVISGATHSYHTFIKLSEAALANARQRNSRTALVHRDSG